MSRIIQWILDNFQRYKGGWTITIGSILLIVYGVYIRTSSYTDFKDYIKELSIFVPVGAAVTATLIGIIDFMKLFSDAYQDYRKKRDKRLKAEAKAERDLEWIEWSKNGKDPDKMPSKINPVDKSSQKLDGNKK